MILSYVFMRAFNGYCLIAITIRGTCISVYTAAGI